jgi:valyl-tRNA synthetase
MEEAFLSYRFNEAAQTAYEFFWNDFCDWYVEATKLSLKNGDDAEKDRATTVLLDVLSCSLRLLHPLLPFVTEEIYSKLPNTKDGELLIMAPYPEYREELSDKKAEDDFILLQDIVRQIRTLRSECTIKNKKKLNIFLNVPGNEVFVRNNESLLCLLAGIGSLEISGNDAGLPKEKTAGSIGLAGNGFEAFVFIKEAVDVEFLTQKFSKELEKDLKYISSIKSKLENNNFIKNAPPELVAAERVKLEEALNRSAKLDSYIKDMREGS